MDQAIELFDRFDEAIEGVCETITFCDMFHDIEEKLSEIHSCGTSHHVTDFVDLSFTSNMVVLNSLIGNKLEKLLNDSAEMICEEFESHLLLFIGMMYWKWDIYRKSSELPATQA